MLTRNWLKVTLSALVIVLLASFVSADTVSVPINKSNYTKINTTLGPITIEARSDRVYLAFSETQPELWSQAAHMLEADEVIKFGVPSSGVWALATAPNQNVVVTEEVDLIERASDGSVGLKSYTQDQTTPPFFIKFNQVTNTTTLASTASQFDTDITVTSAVGINVGDYTGLFNLVTNRFYVGTVLAINANVLTMDTPLDSQFEAGDTVGSGVTNMAVDGTLASPEIFTIRGADPGLDITIDVTRLIITCTTTDTVDLSKFGDIVGGITNGLVIRRVDGLVQNFLNWKTNGDIAGAMYDFDVQQTINPAQGQDGFIARLTFAGANKLGVAVRIAPGESLQSLVQDLLATLGGIITLEIIAEGHVVQ